MKYTLCGNVGWEKILSTQDFMLKSPLWSNQKIPNLEN
jgi:hypothetical protein